jgi:hypothetical protein
MKFDVELGHNTMAMKFPYLHIQAWDKDIFKYSDCIAEGLENLGEFFNRAYKKGEDVECFKKRNLPKELESARFRKMQKDARQKIEEEKRRETMSQLDLDPVAEEDVEMDVEQGGGGGGEGGGEEVKAGTEGADRKSR